VSEGAASELVPRQVVSPFLLGMNAGLLATFALATYEISVELCSALVLVALAGPAALQTLQEPTERAPLPFLHRGEIETCAVIAAAFTFLPSFAAWVAADKLTGTPWHVPAIKNGHLNVPGWFMVWGTLTFGVAILLVGARSSRVLRPRLTRLGRAAIVFMTGTAVLSALLAVARLH
jgi:hypothetical protein